jgi:hypothetical protein
VLVLRFPRGIEIVFQPREQVRHSARVAGPPVLA